MSRGTPITCIRIPPALLAEIDQAIDSNNVWRVDEEYNRTSWIIQAIKERLKKQERGRRTRGRRREEATAAGAGPEQAPV